MTEYVLVLLARRYGAKEHILREKPLSGQEYSAFCGRSDKTNLVEYYGGPLTAQEILDEESNLCVPCWNAFVDEVDIPCEHCERKAHLTR